MATKAKAAKKTKLQRGDGGSPEAFTTIAEVVSVSGPKLGLGTVEATSFDSDAVEHIGTIPDSGEISFNLNWVGDDPGQQGLETDRRNGTLRNFKVVYNDHATTPTTFTLSALVKEISLNAGGPNAKYEASVTLRTSGTTTITYPP
jgi:hypothetical protein